MNLDTFEERNNFGQEAVNKTLNILREKNILCGYNISPKEWEKNKPFSFEWKILRKKDEELGDIWINTDFFTAEIKRGQIALQTIENFKGNIYLIWSSDLLECRVINPNEFKNINKQNCSILKSGKKGFSYEQIKILKYILLDDFLKTI